MFYDCIFQTLQYLRKVKNIVNEIIVIWYAEFFLQTEIFPFLYLCNLMVYVNS